MCQSLRRDPRLVCSFDLKMSVSLSLKDGESRVSSGTSMSTPHVAGVMAILSTQYNFGNVQGLYDKTRQVATKDCISGMKEDTVNLLLYNNYK